MEESTYTLPGVMQFLRSEWQKRERQTIDWELERAQMRSTISNLQNEKLALQKERDNARKELDILFLRLKNAKSANKDGSNGAEDSENTSSNQGAQDLTYNDDNTIKEKIEASRVFLNECVADIKNILRNTNITNTGFDLSTDINLNLSTEQSRTLGNFGSSALLVEFLPNDKIVALTTKGELVLWNNELRINTAGVYHGLNSQNSQNSETALNAQNNSHAKSLSTATGHSSTETIRSVEHMPSNYHFSNCTALHYLNYAEKLFVAEGNNISVFDSKDKLKLKFVKKHTIGDFGITYLCCHKNNSLVLTIEEDGNAYCYSYQRVKQETVHENIRDNESDSQSDSGYDNVNVSNDDGELKTFDSESNPESADQNSAGSTAQDDIQKDERNARGSKTELNPPSLNMDSFKKISELGSSTSCVCFAEIDGEPMALLAKTTESNEGGQLNGLIFVVDPISGEIQCKIIFSVVKKITAIACVNDTVVIGTANGDLQTFGLKRGEILSEFNSAHRGDITCLSPISPNLVASAGADGRVSLWSVPSLIWKGRLYNHDSAYGINALAVSDSNELAVAGGDAVIRLYNL